MTDSAAVQVVQEQGTQVQPANAPQLSFWSADGFALIQRMAKMFSSSTLVPAQYQGADNLSNCVVALNMAKRMDADPLMVMQNLYVVYGNPSWSSKFLIAMFNQCGRYTSIKYRETGKKGADSQGVIAYTTEKATGEVIEGPEVTIGIAKAEGWFGKNGSKWKTMPDQMLRYRAAAWMIRTTAPELSMGLQTQEEIIDITPAADPIEQARNEIYSKANQETFEAVPEELPPAAPAVKVPVKQEAPKMEATDKKGGEPTAQNKSTAIADGPGF